MEKGYLTELDIKFPREMTSEEAERYLSQSIYNVAVHFYEHIGEHGRLTDGKKIIGNGHHMAQKIALQASELWKERVIDPKTKP